MQSTLLFILRTLQIDWQWINRFKQYYTLRALIACNYHHLNTCVHHQGSNSTHICKLSLLKSTSHLQRKIQYPRSLFRFSGSCLFTLINFAFFFSVFFFYFSVFSKQQILACARERNQKASLLKKYIYLPTCPSQCCDFQCFKKKVNQNRYIQT